MQFVYVQPSPRCRRGTFCMLFVCSPVLLLIVAIARLAIQTNDISTFYSRTPDIAPAFKEDGIRV